MLKEEFQEFIDVVIPTALFHISPNDIDNETGAKLDEVILVKLIAANPSCLIHMRLQWFINKFLNYYCEK